MNTQKTDIVSQHPSACSSDMEWKKADGYSSYLISEYGDVVNIDRNRRIKGSIDYDGYHSYCIVHDVLGKTSIKTHRLVAMAFIGNPKKEETHVRHKNGSRVFNHYSNLSWATPKQNSEDTVAHGTCHFTGERNPKAKITEDDVKYIRFAHREIKEGRMDCTVNDLANRYNLHIATICNIARRKTWKHVK